MIKLDIITGFLGAGKTTMINKLLAESFSHERVAIIENEFGDVGIDGDLLPADIPVRQLSSGCICCTLKGDFIEGVASVAKSFEPDRIIIEPTGLADPGDMLTTCKEAQKHISLEINSVITVVNTVTLTKLLRCGGDVFRRQLTEAKIVFLGRIEGLSEELIEEAVTAIRELNPAIPIIKRDWRGMKGDFILSAAEVCYAESEHPEGCGCGCCGNGECDCGNSTDGYTSANFSPSSAFTAAEADRIFAALDSGKYGEIMRAKGFLRTQDGMLRLEYTCGGGESFASDYAGESKFVVIGRELNAQGLAELLK